MTKSSEKHTIPFWKQDNLSIKCPYFGYPTCNFSPLNKYSKEGFTTEYMWEKLYKDIISGQQKEKNKIKDDSLELVGQI